jgi:internalin A
VPQLLPVPEPEFPLEGAVLHFVIRFPEFLPDSIFPRLMVKLHPFIKDDLRWRSGMVLHKPNVFDAAARVRADKEDKEIRIDVCGTEPRRFLSFIRETVKEIVRDFVNLPFEEMVPIPDSELFRSYDELVELEKMGEKEFAIGKLKRKFSVSDLLDGVEEPAMRDAIGQTPVKAFVSYSHKDRDFLPELRAALSPLVRLNKLQIWDDRAIDAGTDWEKEIFQQLEEADLVLCLVSHDFINSDFCYTKELEFALDAHHRGERTVVPIQLRACAWEGLPLAAIQGTPGRWIGSQPDKDAAWTEVAKHLGPAIDKTKVRKVNR